jgi:hypothetical protein
VLVAEFFGEERVDERDVVVNATRLEDFLPAQPDILVPFPFAT